LKIEALRDRENCSIPLGSFSENQDVEKDVPQQMKLKSTVGSSKTKWKNNWLCCAFFCEHLQILNKKRVKIGD
jgi:hypothetical protein